MPISKSKPPLFLFLLVHFAAAYGSPDANNLLLFKSSADPHNTILTSWNASSDPCTSSWLGVTCLRRRVSRLLLPNLHLRGPLPRSLASLTQLRLLSLTRNQFSGQIPDLSNLTSLKLIYLSHNQFSGDFPISLTSLSKPYRLDLSNNNFTGNVPASLNRMTNLLTLKLEENGFSGSIPGLRLQNLQEFNVSGNDLMGEIPDSLSSFPISSFQNNRVLCGPPLEKCKAVSSDPTLPGGVMGPAANSITSSPSGIPKGANPTINPENSHRGKFSSLAIIGIILSDVVVLALVSTLLYCYFWRNHSNKAESGKSSGLGQKTVYGSSPGHERGKIVFFEEVRRFELEDLLRASAEMLGKGGFGTAYKAILDEGNVVAVKRLKDVCVKKEFEQQMEILGRLKHPNLVELKAYYFAKDEKLLVYDYMPNSNLFWLLHGNRGPGRTPLDWTTRLKIAAGAAREVAFIHSSCKSLKLIHGNIKSTNVLIDKDGNARVSDFGLSVLASPSSIPKSNGYRAPEAPSKVTQKSDVYSFGVLLLELLTGKCPESSGSSGPCVVAVDLVKWVQSVVREEWTAEVFDLELLRYKNIEEEMVGLLQIGMACAQTSPDERPNINLVVNMIDGLRPLLPQHL